MAGVVLETVSNRKLIAFGLAILVLQVVFFLIGGLIAPAPSNVQSITGTICLDLHNLPKDAWFTSRGESKCPDVASSFDDEIIQQKKITTNQVVFTFQFPLPREHMELEMSRWFQNIISVLHPHVEYLEHATDMDPLLTMDVRLGGRDSDKEEWTEIVRSTEERRLHCEPEGQAHAKASENDTEVHETNELKSGESMQCDLLSFFELGSCHYNKYLVNIRIPVHDDPGLNHNIGALKELTLVEIHQNGGFTKVWFSMKTVVFPLLFFVMCWFWNRIASLERPPMLLEKTLFALGLVLSFMNMPIEWLTLRFDMPYMLLLGDIRQGLFYAMLLCFWIIFTGEHMMDQIERNRLVMYWKHLSAVIFGCICLFVFEMCERGVQLTNPFYSIWVTETGTKLAFAFIILAGISACLYFLFLCYMIFRVFRNISAKRSALPSMNKARRKYYTGLIYRFKFLMMVTLVASATTTIFFIISQVSEGNWKWADDLDYSLEYTSAFFTGVYGMWNLYVGALLILYAPSHKQMAVLETTDGVPPGKVALKFYVPYRPKDDCPDTDVKASGEKPQTAGAGRKVPWLKKTVCGSGARGTSGSAPFKAILSALLDWFAGIARDSSDQDKLTKSDEVNKTKPEDM